MALARDWLKTLWPASYKGVRFFVESDEEEGGRRIVVHQFPMRDQPFLEDLGEDKRAFEVTAYVASDSADSDAATVIATCAMRGAGALVLPTHGPMIVRCISFRRDRSKDKHGYIGLRLNFVREGAATALSTVAMLANLVFIAADNAALAIAASFVANIQIGSVGVPDFVNAAASDGAQDAIATLEAIRTSEPVDPAASATQRNVIQALFDQSADLVSVEGTSFTVASGIVAAARALGDAMPPASAVAAFDALATDPSFVPVQPAVPHQTASARAAATNAAATLRTLRLAALTAYAEAVARVPLADRPTAITLRANVAEYFEGEIEDLPSAEIDLYRAIASIRDAVIEYLSRAILDLAAVLTVEVNLSMPSLYWAWRLYQDPNRSTELVNRNRLAHPSFMPTAFEALAK